MRLIDVKTLKLKEFFGTKAPHYAILSHAWTGEEVTFQEWQATNHFDLTDVTVKNKMGYSKIVGACHRAASDGLGYLWCDTNCIDKTSSAELTEAINSMFAWYHNSQVCYAYLQDVEFKNMLPESRWFTRGWTLQELLAPTKVVFFDRRWRVYGDRMELSDMISRITRIHVGVLKDRETIHDYSIAQRMSWAADRQTTREEDIAYCLLGIFDINMPLLYGERSNAFIRLQHEIIKISNDQSIFAWDLRQPDAHPFTSALATSPSEFLFCGSIARNDETQGGAFSITNMGISMSVTLIETLVDGIALAGLNCGRELRMDDSLYTIPHGGQLRRQFKIWIPLRHSESDVFVRAHLPASRVHLENSYFISQRPMATKLFLSLDKSYTNSKWPFANSILNLRQKSSVSSSGTVVMVGAGTTTRQMQIVSEAYPLGDMSIIQLKRREASTISHQLISRGNFSVIFSVFWGKEALPQKWLHTAICDPKRRIISHLASRAEWRCLFDDSTHTRPSRNYNGDSDMESLHGRLKQAYGGLPVSGVGEEQHPIVSVENPALYDAMGYAELVVTVIFRETLRF